MAGGTHPKPSSNKPSSSQRKSRWESDHNPPADKKPTKPSSHPSPITGPCPVHPQPPTDHVPHSGPAPFPSPGPQFPFPDPSTMGPPPPPAYGFHMLERRTIVLADGSVRSYFALPPGYQDFMPPRRPVDPAGRFALSGPSGRGPEFRGSGFGVDRQFPPGGVVSPDGRGRSHDNWNSLGPMEGSIKRKYGEEEEKDRRDEKGEFGRQRQQLLQYGNPNGYPLGPGDSSQLFTGTSSPFSRDEEMRASKMMRIDGGYETAGLHYSSGGSRGGDRVGLGQNALKKAFLHFAKLVNENAAQKKSYLDSGKHGPLKCIACGRSSFPDMHSLIMHTYNSDNADLRVDHLGLHKALCVLMGWNYSKPPDNSKAYQFLTAEEAVANQDDLIMWPPVVIVHNTLTGKGKDGRMEGLGNKALDNKIRDLGFVGGKSKSLHGRDGHLGISIVKFGGEQSGFKEALRLAEYFERNNHGRKGWARVQPFTIGKDAENHPNLVQVEERTKEKTRVLYGYLGTAADLDKIDFDTKKKVVIESQREHKDSR